MTEAFTRNGTYAHGPLLGILWASPVAQTVKNPPAMQESQEMQVPAFGRSPGGGHGNPLQYSCLENPMDGGSWQAIVHAGCKRVE